jgi:hypothetical protein
MSDYPVVRTLVKTSKMTPRNPAKSQKAIPKSSIVQKISYVNKKIKSFFFGAKELNED